MGRSAGACVGMGTGIEVAVGSEVEAGVGARVGTGVGGVEVSAGVTVAVDEAESSSQGPEFEHGAMIRTNANAKNKAKANALFRVMMFDLITQ